jgi:hypothetical protein
MYALKIYLVLLFFLPSTMMHMSPMYVRQMSMVTTFPDVSRRFLLVIRASRVGSRLTDAQGLWGVKVTPKAPETTEKIEPATDRANNGRELQLRGPRRMEGKLKVVSTVSNAPARVQRSAPAGEVPSPLAPAQAMCLSCCSSIHVYRHHAHIKLQMIAVEAPQLTRHLSLRTSHFRATESPYREQQADTQGCKEADRREGPRAAPRKCGSHHTRGMRPPHSRPAAHGLPVARRQCRRNTAPAFRKVRHLSRGRQPRGFQDFQDTRVHNQPLCARRPTEQRS